MDQILLTKAEKYIFDLFFGSARGDAYFAILQGTGAPVAATEKLSQAEAWLVTHIFGTSAGNAMLDKLKAAGVVAA